MFINHSRGLRGPLFSLFFYSEYANEKISIQRRYFSDDKSLAVHKIREQLFAFESSMSARCVGTSAEQTWPLPVRTTGVIKNGLRVGLWLQVG